MKAFENLLLKLEENLNAIADKETEIVERSKHSITACTNCLEQMKELVLKDGFKNQEQEIHFFKTMKPLALSRLIFHSNILKIETSKRLYSGEGLCGYYRRCLASIADFATSNDAFIQYYNAGSTIFDHVYFTRNTRGGELHNDPTVFYWDTSFSTRYDHVASLILANQSLVGYLDEKLIELQTAQKYKSGTDDRFLLKWTSSKAALVEIIYAFQAEGAINKGRADIVEVANVFENVFNVPLGDIYRKYHDMKIRRGSRTKFLDKIKTSLNRKMDEEEDNE